MCSRIRDRKSVKKIFECYMVVEPVWAQNSNGNTGMVRSPSDPAEWNSTVHSVFPVTYSDQELLKSAAQFAFPCPAHNENVELFTFVLTSGDSKWTFGYCRYPTNAKQCSLFLTHLPWEELFYKALNLCAEADLECVENFLTTLYSTPIPEPSTCLYVPLRSKPNPFVYPCPSDHGLPSIPENRNVSEFYSALGTDSTVKLFASLLSERRIVITSKKLSKLSAIVMACNMFLLPMNWQHIFIPVLPSQLQDYLSAPMPFLIGVPIVVWDRLPPEALGQLVRVDADNDTVTTPFPEDISSIPEDVANFLRKNLSKDKVQGDGLSRAFLRVLVQLMGHYQEAFIEDGDKVEFIEDIFIANAHYNHRPYIESKLLHLQIFQQFIDERLQRYKDGTAVTDEFEREAVAWRSTRAYGKSGSALKSLAGQQNKAIRKAGKAVISSVKREGGHIIETVKQNSALKSAIRSVKEGGKSVKQKTNVAYSDIKSKLNVPSQHQLSIRSVSEKHSPVGRPHRRYGSITSIEKSSIGSANSLEVPHSSHSGSRGSNGNVTQLTSSSSASRLPDAIPSLAENGVKLQPRLSKSEENLIDFDTPDANSSDHFTLENPLYDLVSNNTVFAEAPKTDEQLLTEYGLQDYFRQMTLKDTNVPFDGNFLSNNSSQSVNYSSTVPSSALAGPKPPPSSNTSWIKFD